jgi:hypothetical protein
MPENVTPESGDFCLYGIDGQIAARVDKAGIFIDWNAVEKLAEYDNDNSPRAKNIARLLLHVRRGGDNENPPAA